jgi:hypothetical protein
MKNIFLYYTILLLPIAGLIMIPSISSGWFVTLLFIYAIPYRTFIDGLRLVNKNVIKWNEIWKLWVP